MFKSDIAYLIRSSKGIDESHSRFRYGVAFKLEKSSLQRLDFSASSVKKSFLIELGAYY